MATSSPTASAVSRPHSRAARSRTSSTAAVPAKADNERPSQKIVSGASSSVFWKPPGGRTPTSGARCSPASTHSQLAYTYAFG